MSRAKNIIKELEKLGENPTIIETGTIRNTKQEYAEGDGHSTLHIARWIKENGGTFHSIDLHIATSMKYITQLGLAKYVNYHQGNSLNVLPKLKGDLYYLDSANDADLILEEFKLVEPHAKTVIIDDVDPNNPELQKGLKVISYIDGKYDYKIENRHLTIWLKK